MSSRRRVRRQRESAELNITAFMNLMVVLVPFLLITAVFSRITILELNLPAADDKQPVDDTPSLNLTVIVRPDALHVYAVNKLLKSFPKEEKNYPFSELNTFLQKIKKRQPDVVNARVLLEPDIKYDVLVSVMDSVRIMTNDGETSELFPAISIGDAAPVAAEASQQ